MTTTTWGWGYAPGTFGEVLQGEWQDTPFLVTLPIRWGTQARFVPTEGKSVQVFPPYREKARKAAALMCREIGKPGGYLAIASVLPMGKGLASSSADVVAAIRAVAGAYNIHLEPGYIAELAARIEPSDGIMYPGMVAFNPRQGKLLERLGPVPHGVVVGVLGPGRVNTVAHHQSWLSYTPDQQKRLMQAMEILRRAVPAGDIDGIGQAGRISAEIELEREPNDDLLAKVLHVARGEGYGVLVAHSGTARGFLFGPEAVASGVVRRAEALLTAMNRGPVHRFWTWARLVPIQGHRVCTVSPAGTEPS